MYNIRVWGDATYECNHSDIYDMNTKTYTITFDIYT